MAEVKIEFVLKNGDKVVTTNKTIIKQLAEQKTAYKVLEGSINDVIQTQDEQVISTNEVTKSYQDVLKEYKANVKELNALAIAGETNSERFQELQKSVAAAKDALEDNSRAVGANKSGADALIGSIGGVAAGFSAAQGAIGLFGGEAQNIEKALLRVQSSIALLQGIEGLKDAGQSFSSLANNIKGPVVSAFTTLKGAIAATGIGLLVVAVGTLAANWDKFTETLTSAFPGFKVVTDFFKNFGNIALGTVSAVVEGFKVIGDVIGNIFQGEFSKAAEAAGSFGERVGKAYQQGFNDAVEEEQTQANIKRLEQEVRLAEARGEETIQLELKLVRERLRIAKEGSDEYKDLIVEETKLITAQEKKVTDAREANTKRRLSLLNDGLNKELQLLRFNYEQERKEAAKKGENLILVDKLYEKQRQDLIDKSNKQVIDDIQSFELQNDKLVNERYTREAQGLLDQYNELRQLAINNITDKEELNSKLTSIDSTFYQNQLLIQRKYIREAQQAFEDFANKEVELELFSPTSPEIFQKRIDELKEIAIVNQLEILDDEVVYRRNLFEIALNADNEELDRALKLFEQKKDLNDSLYDGFSNRTKEFLKEIQFYNQEELNEAVKLRREKNELDRKELNEELTNYQQLQTNRIKLVTNFNKNVRILDKQDQKNSLDNEINYYKKLNSIALNGTKKSKKEEERIKKEFERAELGRQIELTNKKLDIALTAYGIESEEYKKLLAEKLKLENEFLGKSEENNKLTLDTYLNLFQQFLSTLSEVGAAIDSFYELRSSRTNKFYDEEVQKNEDARNTEINNYALTEEEKSNINERFALKETEIEQKRSDELKQIEKKRADVAFKIQVAQIIGNTALATIRAFAELGPIAGSIAAVLVAATGTAQIIAANNQRKAVQQLEDGGLLSGPSHSNGGIPVGNTGIEVEGNEFVVNKRSTAKYLPVLQAINNDKTSGRPNMSAFMGNGIMERGGIVPQMNSGTIIKTYVVDSEVTNKQAMNSKIKRSSTF